MHFSTSAKTRTLKNKTEQAYKTQYFYENSGFSKQITTLTLTGN